MERSVLSRRSCRVKVKRWLNTLPEVVPAVVATRNHSAQTEPPHKAASHQGTLSDVWLSTRLDTRTRQKASPAGRHYSSFIPLDHFVLRPGRKKVARNAPKRHSSCLCCAGVFVFVVA